MSFVFNGVDIQSSTTGTGTSIRRSVKVASTANVNLTTDLSSGLIDGVVVNVNDRVLLKNQSNPIENGIYLIGSGIGATIRAEDYIEGSNAASTMMYVQQGTVNADTGWLCTNDSGTDIIGTNALNYQQFSGTGVDGNMNGPGSSTDNAITRWDGASGSIVQNSNVLLDDLGNLSGIRYLEINDVSIPANPSNGQGRLYKKTGDDGVFWKPDSAGAEVDLTSTATASNQGTAGTGVFIQKTGLDLEFKNINSGSSKITVTDDVGNNEIDIDVDETAINHNNLLNFATNEHIDHSTVTLTAGEGLGGGGDITASRTFDLDINGLTAETNVDSASDYAVIYDTSAGAHRKVLFNDLPAGNPEREIIVAQSGGDENTIDAGITAASALTPTSSNPVVVRIYPGTYTVTNPLTIPSYVTLVGIHDNTVIIQPTTTTAVILVLADESVCKNVIISGANGTGGIGLQVSSGNLGYIRCVSIRNCEIGIQSTGSGTIANIENINIFSPMGEAGIETVSGGHIICTSLRILGTSLNPIPTGCITNGSGSVIDLTGGNLLYCTTGLRATNTATMNSIGTIVRNSTNGVRVDANSIAHIYSSLIVNSSNLDIQLEDATAEIHMTGNINNEKISDIDNFTVIGGYTSKTDNDDPSFSIQGELSVGRYNAPVESIFGGGDSYTNTMVVFRNTNLLAGTFTDVTTEAKSSSASSFNLFPGTGVNNACFIGGDYIFPGIKAIIDAGISPNTSKVLVWEYWNGSTWTEINTMSVDAGSPYEHHGNRNFNDPVNEQIRFATTPNWTQTTVNGSNKYWVRVYITSTLTTIPVLERIKLHTNRTEINADGFIELYGTARPLKQLSWNINTSLGQPSLVPADQDVFLSDNLAIGQRNNSFSQNGIDRIGLNALVPTDIDTSLPILFSFVWNSDDTTGNIKWVVRWANVPPQALVYYTSGAAPSTYATEQSVDLISAVPTTQYQTKVETVELDISNTIINRGGTIGDVLWITLERQGNDAADTSSSNCTLIQIAPFYRIWNVGGHVQ